MRKEVVLEMRVEARDKGVFCCDHMTLTRRIELDINAEDMQDFCTMYSREQAIREVLKACSGSIKEILEEK